MKDERPLAGCVVGISISETEEMDRLGFDRSEMNRCVVRLSESLLGAGARLAFGHDWRPGGVMVAVAALAVRYFRLRHDLAGDSHAQAPIINRVPWPNVPFLSEPPEDADEGTSRPALDPMVRMLKGIVEARQTEVPSGTTPAKALSLMRAELADLCDVRVCLGGKLAGYSGKMPGIVEEALGALQRERPVFASGIFGGASALVARAMDPEGDIAEGKSLPDVLLASLLEIRELSVNVGRGLTPEEERFLCYCTSTEQCVELVLRGTVKWRAKFRSRD
jgi:hypothetical protein